MQRTPVIVYDAQDGKMDGAERLHGPRDRAILGVARLADPTDKYLLRWERQKNNPVVFDGPGGPFPSQIWKSKNGDYWNMIATTCPGGGDS